MNSPLDAKRKICAHFKPPSAGALSVILAAVALSALTACSDKKVQAVAGPPAAPVTVAEAGQETVPVEVRAIGAGEAYSTVTVTSQVAGTIQRVSFVEGQFVNAGDLLFSIDPSPFQAALQQSEANLARDIAQSHYAESQAGRYENLLKSGIVSVDQYDQFKSNSQALQASVRADQAAVETAKIQLGYCTIRSPISGKTGSLLAHPGSVVKVNDTNLVVINQISPIYVDFSVPEQYLAEIKQRFAAGKVKVTAEIPDQKTPAIGALSFINNTVDNTTGTVLLKGIFANDDRRLWPGQFVNVVLVLSSQPDLTVVPSQAVQTGQTGAYIYVVNPDLTVTLRPVQAGATYEGQTVISKGLRPGEKVVTEGQLRLYPGAKVTIKSSQAGA